MLSLAALIVAVTFARREFFPPRANDPFTVVTQSDWKEYAVGEMRIGPPTARVMITEFSDFECPACLRLYRRLEKVRSRYPDDVTIVYRNFPLDDLHPSARPAAVAAQCAALHGQFPAYYRHLFENQETLKSANWSLIARQNGVTDTASFTRCLSAPAIAEQVRADSMAAARLGIVGTPMVLINDRLYKAAPSQAVLDSLIAALVERRTAAAR